MANREPIESHREDPLAFHYDREAATNEAIGKARDLGERLGARSMQSAIEEMNEGLKAPCRPARAPHYAESK